MLLQQSGDLYNINHILALLETLYPTVKPLAHNSSLNNPGKRVTFMQTFVLHGAT